MTKIKLCGLSRPCDIDFANALEPEFIGFVFTARSKRSVLPEMAARLKQLLDPKIQAVGVFVDEKPEVIADLSKSGIIDAVQLHGGEDEAYVRRLRRLIDIPIIKAFRIQSTADALAAERCSADHVMLDSGAGTGRAFDWTLIRHFRRPFFLAGGLSPENVSEALDRLHPFAVDVSSGIETNESKDRTKMAAFIAAVRKGDNS